MDTLTNKTYRAKVTGRHVITLPAELCRQIGIEVGDVVEFEVNGNQAILRLPDEDPVVSLRGILKDYFPDWESVEQFIEEERSDWERRTDQLWMLGAADEKQSPGS
jgi:bifunctional DNA-binding transcriptional regulator/antitoxin component of YhaV-PrlF toxin-antitoxin module